jgi:dTDP-4-amino-4,6-dideoxygalactose transaminase
VKQYVKDLAIFGGQTLFTHPLAVGRPNQLDRETFLARIADVLDSGQLTNDGPQVKSFEAGIRRVTGTRHAIAVCNGTMALQIMAMACELRGDVIVPAMTFIATAHALKWVGLNPVFADVDRTTHTLDVDSVEACISPSTSAILGVHLWGNPCDVHRLRQVAEQHDLPLLFDASHAFGCKSHGVRIGGLGDAEAFSFHATKVLQAIEGGAITTNNDHLADRCRRLRNFGITGLTEISDIGTNGKMSEISAAAGLTSFASFPDVIEANQRNYIRYHTETVGIPGLDLIRLTADQRGNAQYVVAHVVERKFGMSRNDLLSILRAEGIFARSYFEPGCHNAAPYAAQPAHHTVDLPVTDRVLSEVIQFPTGTSVSVDDIAAVTNVIKFAQRHSAEVKSCRLARNSQLVSHPQDPVVFAPLPDAA